LNYVTIQAIKEIRSFNSPIHLAKKVQTALCILLAECKTDWKSSKLNLCNALRYFNRNNVSDETLDKLTPFIKSPQFVPNKIAQVFAFLSYFIFFIKNKI